MASAEIELGSSVAVCGGDLMKRNVKKTIKKMLVFPIYFIHFLIVEVLLGAGVGDVWDKMLKWTDK